MLPLALLSLAAAAPPPPVSPPLPPSAPLQNCTIVSSDDGDATDGEGSLVQIIDEAGTFLAESEAGLRVALQCGLQSGRANIRIPAQTTINLTSALEVDGSRAAEAELPVINISGGGGAAIDAQGRSGVLFASRVSLYVRGLRIANGNQGCVRLYRTLARFEDVSVEGCRTPGNGGGFFIEHSQVAFERVLIRHCVAAQNGGGVVLTGSGSLVALHSSIAHCSAGSYEESALFYFGGGGLAAEHSALFMAHTNITDCRVHSRTNSYGGGAYLTSTYSRFKSVKIGRCSARSPDGTAAAGGLYVESSAGDRMNFLRANVSRHSYWREVPPFTDELRDDLSGISWRELANDSDVGSWRAAEEPWLLDAYDLEVVGCAAEGLSAYGGCIREWHLL